MLGNSYNNNHQPTQLQVFRINILVAILIVLSLILILRLAYLQISEYKRYQTLSLKNQLNVIPIDPPRGLITDRNGILLAENIPVYSLEVIPERVRNIKKQLANLQKLIASISEEDIDVFFKLKKQNPSFIPISLKLKLTPEEVSLFAVNQYLYPGFSIKARSMRYYGSGKEMAHILGFVGRISAAELKQLNKGSYRATNFVGKAGIEKYYESILHGKPGYQQVETDVSGRTLRVIQKKPPVAGQDLKLTIDSKVQKAAFNSLQGKRGAIVLINARNGEVIAMVSSPSYDSNLFVNGISRKEYEKLIKDSDDPMFNRALRGNYAPASTIKPFVALTGLINETITPYTQIYDPGSFKLKNSSHIYRDWKKRGHGMVNLRRAIITSCDTYFYRLGNQLGITKIAETLRAFGFGEPTNIDLSGELKGVVPSPFWKRKNQNIAWYPGDTLISAIGQGFMLSTPLQLASATATLGQKGIKYTPHLLKSVSIHGENRYLEYVPKKINIPIKGAKAYYWDTISAAMKEVIVNKEGTGFRFGRLKNYTVAAKTGTAQVYSGKKYENSKYEDIPERLRDNALFIGFAPHKNPEVAIAVIVENDYTASNVARKVMDAYFKGKNHNE